MSSHLFFKGSNRWLIGLVLGATAVTGAIAYYGISSFGQAKPPETPIVAPSPLRVTALGRLEPETEVINLSAPLALDGDRVAELRVKQGDEVKAGQVIAVLTSYAGLQDALRQAQADVSVAQAKLAQVQAGAKSGEIAAQQATVQRDQAQLQGERAAQAEAVDRLAAQLDGDRTAQAATIRRLEAELANAEAEYQRYQQLYRDGAISNSQFDSKRLSMDTTRQQLSEAKAVLNRIEATGQKQLSEAKANLDRIDRTGKQQVSESKATLDQIAEVRPVDVQAAQAEVETAIAAAKKAATELEQAYIRAPQAGQILKIHTRPGEKISDNGIVDLGQTSQMVAVAEVYQTDIGKIKLGQTAIVRGQAFAGELRGQVSEIGRQVSRQNVFSNEPGENRDKRVVEVKIRLKPEDNKRVAGFTNLQVETAIDL